MKKKTYFINNFIYIPIILELFVYKNKILKKKNKKKGNKVVLRNLFGFQNNYIRIIVLNNFFKNIKASNRSSERIL